MKKYLVISTFILVFIAAGCGNKDVQTTTQSAPTDTTTTTESTSPATTGTSPSTDESNSAKPKTTTTTNPTSSTDSSVKTYTLAEVGQHKTSGDCWAAVNGGVYNLTPWIEKHPGGSAAIISLWGTDGSAIFNKQHGSAENANKALASFKIGNLK